MNKYTIFHLAAFKLFNAMNVIAVAFVKACHVVALLFACTPTTEVEGEGNIFIVTLFITIGVILWMAALTLVNVIEVSGWSCTQFEAVQVVSRWTQRPDMKTEKRLKLFPSKYQQQQSSTLKGQNGYQEFGKLEK